MTIDMFVSMFYFTAISMNVGLCTTVQYEGKAYTFRKTKPGEFERVIK